MSQRGKSTVDRAFHRLEEKIDDLIPETVKRVPEWYQVASFQYNWRCALGFLPGAVLMAVVTGKTMVAVFLLCVLVVMLVSSLGLGFIAILLTIVSAFFCQLTSVYLMFPLIWHSFLNLPLLMIFHIFVAVVVAWGLINNATFREQDPRIVLLVEQVLFAVLPGLTILMLTWVCAMLLGKESVPAVLTITGVLAVSLFVVPLESSFAKPRTPFNNGLILHRAIAVVYLFLVSGLPGLFYLVLYPLSLTKSVNEFVSFQLHTILPTFLLSLLEAQSVFHWTGLAGRSVEVIRWLSTGLTMALLSIYVLTLAMATYLPALVVPILFAMFGLVSSLSSELAYSSLVAVVTTVVVAALYIVSAFLLPWNVSYQFSLLSMPLGAVQLLLLLLALASLPLLLGWQRDLTLLWPTYHAVFVGCEFILSRENLYPLSLLLATSVAAILLCTRLYAVRRLPLPLGILCLCIHVLKLSQFLPSLPSSPSSTLSLLSSVGLLLAGLALVRLFSSDPPLPLSIFLALSGLFAVGMLLAADSFLAPAIAAVTHSPPSAADMASIMCVSLGVLIRHFLPLVSSSATGKESVSLIPPALFLLAGLFWLLQPEFNPLEFFKALGTIALYYADIKSFHFKPEVAQLAWSIVLKWVLILVTCLCVVMIAIRKLLLPVSVHVPFALLGLVSGFSVAMELMHHPPVSTLGLLYASAGTVSALLLSSLLFSPGKRCQRLWQISLFAAILVLCAVSMATEWLYLPEVTTGRDADTLYDLLPQVRSLPCSRLYLLVFLSIAAVLKFQSMARDKPVLPFLCNVCCGLVYLLAITNNPLPVPLDLAVLVSTASCVFLLAQADEMFIPKTSGLFLAPSLAVTSLTLFSVGLYQVGESMAHLYDKTDKDTAVAVLGLVCLVAAVPGHVVFIHSMWTNKPVKMRVTSLLLYILPNAMLSQFGTGTGNVLLGATAILSFSLLAFSDVLTSRTPIHTY